MIPEIRWRLRLVSPAGKTYDLPARVPGCVHADLIRAGILGDFFYRDDARKIRWIEETDPVYEGSFSLAAIPEAPVLILYGVDVYADVFLNGHPLGKTDDAFIPWRFPVDGILREGENRLEIFFRSPVRETAGLPPRSGAFTIERLYTRRMQCTYGWDWVDRFVTMGLWKPVEILSDIPDLPFPRNDGIYVFTSSINSMTAVIGVRLSYPAVSRRAWAGIEILSPGGETVITRRIRLLEKEISLFFDVPDPALWYPAGYGGQPLYLLRVSTFPDGSFTGPLRVQEVPFGIRTAEILEPEDAPGSSGALLSEKLRSFEHLRAWDRNTGSSAFLLLINGRPVFCEGADWVPPEPFPSEDSPEKIERLVSLAREAGVNMLRVWGGGVFGSEALYAACDRAGILLTQDFLMACGDYPEEDPAFLEKLRLEAREAAVTLRNHPSLVWWSGDNENAVAGDGNSENYNGRASALYAIGPVLEKEDPRRRFLPSSPYGGVPYASATRGTAHVTQYLSSFFAWVREGDFHDYRRYFDRYLTRFTPEQPAIGMPFVSSLLRFMTPEDVFGEDSSISAFHTKNNPGLGEVTLYGYVERLAEGIFGSFRDGADRVRKMQLLQCEWIRLSLSLYRRNAWYSSGILYWMWNDCWPAANGWSLIDYYGRPKPAWYAFREAAAPFALSILPDRDGETLVFLSFFGAGDVAEGTGVLSRYRISDGKEDLITPFSFTAHAGESPVVLAVPSILLGPDTILLAEAETPQGRIRAFSLPDGMAYSDMTFPLSGGDFAVLAEDPDTILIEGRETCPYVILDRPDAILSENLFFLKKGERRLIRKRDAGPLYGLFSPSGTSSHGKEI